MKELTELLLLFTGPMVYSFETHFAKTNTKLQRVFLFQVISSGDSDDVALLQFVAEIRDHDEPPEATNTRGQTGGQQQTTRAA